MVVCGSNDGLVYGFHSRTGKIVWSYNAGAEVKAGCSLSPKEKYVAFGSFGKEFVVLEIKTGKKIATIETLEVNYSTPCWVDEDIIICTSLDKRVYAFSMKKGVVLWTFVTTARIFASPVVYGGYVFIGNNSACLYVLGVHDGKQYALFQATERITNAVLIDNEHEVLYLRTFADDLYALSMKAFNKSESAHVYLSNEKK
jgi:outer membrane protein assembly factor BamB